MTLNEFKEKMSTMPNLEAWQTKLIVKKGTDWKDILPAAWYLNDRNSFSLVDVFYYKTLKLKENKLSFFIELEKLLPESRISSSVVLNDVKEVQASEVFELYFISTVLPTWGAYIWFTNGQQFETDFVKPKLETEYRQNCVEFSSFMIYFESLFERGILIPVFPNEQ